MRHFLKIKKKLNVTSASTSTYIFISISTASRISYPRVIPFCPVNVLKEYFTPLPLSLPLLFPVDIRAFFFYSRSTTWATGAVQWRDRASPITCSLPFPDRGGRSTKRSLPVSWPGCTWRPPIAAVGLRSAHRNVDPLCHFRQKDDLSSTLMTERISNIALKYLCNIKFWMITW